LTGSLSFILFAVNKNVSAKVMKLDMMHIVKVLKVLSDLSAGRTKLPLINSDVLVVYGHC